MEKTASDIPKRDAILQFTNCRLIWKHAIIREDLWVCDGKILDPQKLFFDGKRSADMKFDCGDCLIAPGFIELQINGKSSFLFTI
jgi:N-acetylglucosamine-6-phosphate deacetylase